MGQNSKVHYCSWISFDTLFDGGMEEGKRMDLNLRSLSPLSTSYGYCEAAL